MSYDNRRSLDDMEQSLALAAPDAPVRIQLARSLETASRGSFVHIDGRGQVRSPTRYHALSALSYGVSAGAILMTTALYMLIFGPLGAGVGVALGGALAFSVQRSRRMMTAAALIQADRLDEAEVLCREMLVGKLVPRRLRAAAHHNLAAIAVRRGQHDVALEHVRQAIALRHSALKTRNVLVELLLYMEVLLLVNLGRSSEARARLEARGPVPEGDYLRMQHWTAELYVQFAESDLRLEEDALWERSQAALRITGAAQLLALCSWGYLTRRDEDLGRHLLEQAIDRYEPASAAVCPLLWQWVRTRCEAFELTPPEE